MIEKAVRCILRRGHPGRCKSRPETVCEECGAKRCGCAQAREEELEWADSDDSQEPLN